MSGYLMILCLSHVYKFIYIYIFYTYISIFCLFAHDLKGALFLDRLGRWS